MQKLFQRRKVFLLVLLMMCSLQAFAQEHETQKFNSDYSNENDSKNNNVETNVFKSTAAEENKIYKDYSLDSSLRENIIPKEKLLYDNYKVIRNKSKISDKQNIKSNVKLSNQGNRLRPWLFLLCSIVVLFLIFKFIKSK